jgi:hypothetical protein
MRRLEVTIESKHCALVKGYGSRDLLTELRGGRPPVWATLSRAWVTTADTARDLIAVAERRGYLVDVETLPHLRDKVASPLGAGSTQSSSLDEADPGRGLW